MRHPPGTAPDSTLSGEQITADGDLDLSTKNGQRRYLCDRLGVSQREARLLLAAYEADLERPLATAGQSYRPGFLRWLMEQAPGGRPARAVRKHDWRLTSA
jgi:hypothetical protein